MLTPQHQLESLSVAYVKAVTGQAGWTCSSRDFDYGVDLTVHEVTGEADPATGGTQYGESGAAIDIQVKGTRKATVEAGSIVYDLDSRTYNRLCAKVQTPRILVLYVAPRTRVLVEQNEDRLVVVGCCYWMSFEGCQPTSNRRKKRVRIPCTNRFSEAYLTRMTQRLHEGGGP